MRDVLGIFYWRGIDRDIVTSEDLSWLVIDAVFFRVRIAVESINE